MKKLIIMGSYREYLYSEYHQDYDYVSLKEQLYGRLDITLYLRGQYWLNRICRDFQEFNDICQSLRIKLNYEK